MKVSDKIFPKKYFHRKSSLTVSAVGVGVGGAGDAVGARAAADGAVVRPRRPQGFKLLLRARGPHTHSCLDSTNTLGRRSAEVTAFTPAGACHGRRH